MKIKETKMFICSSCGQRYPIDELALRHFAGVYCEECAEEYKRKYSGICGLCGEPRWSCTC